MNLSATSPCPFSLAQGFLSLEPRDGSISFAYFGWKIAHDQMLRAALKYSRAAGIDLFFDPTASLPVEFRSLSKDNAAKGPALRVIDQLPQLAEDNTYVFLNAGYMSTQLAQVRQSMGVHFAICHVVHSVPASLPYAVPWLLGLWLTSHPCDVVLASSSSGKAAVVNLMERTRDYAVSQSGGLSLKPLPTVRQIPLGVDCEFLRPLDRPACRHMMNLGESDIVLLYVGRLSPVQKADLVPLLLTYARLLRLYPTLLMVLAGQTDAEGYARHIQTVAEQLGISDRLRIIPNFSYYSKPAIYGAADIYVSPVDNIQETFGLAVLEAMAMELPVVVPDWSGYRDIVADRQTGFLVPTMWCGEAGEVASQAGPFWGESTNYFLAQRTCFDVDLFQAHLSTLIQDVELTREMGKNGHRRAVARFSWQTVIGALDDIWQEQASQCAVSCPMDSGRDIIDYNSAFCLFATEQVTDTTRVTAAADVDAIEVVLPMDLHAPFGIDAREGRRIVDHCTGQIRSVAELLNAGVASQSSTVAWLLKTGRLRLVRLDSTSDVS